MKIFLAQQYNAFQVKGFKKVENYIKKEEDQSFWIHNVSPEEREYMEIQAELEKELHKSHLL